MGSDSESSDEEEIADLKKSSSNKKDGKVAGKKSATGIASSVLYLGHLPLEFGEHEIAQFCKQFGRVLNVKLFRSLKKPFRSKGYAFVKMKTTKIASIVADTLSGYLLKGEKRLVCHIVPRDKLHDDMFRRPNLEKLAKESKKRQNVSTISADKLKKRSRQAKQRQEKKRQLLQKIGYDYDLEADETSSPKKKARTSKSPSSKLKEETPSSSGNIAKSPKSPSSQQKAETPSSSNKNSKTPKSPSSKQKAETPSSTSKKAKTTPKSQGSTKKSTEEPTKRKVRSSASKKD